MEPKYRRPLNPKQKQILLVLYKFRFGTLEQLHRYQGMKSVTASRVRLKILLDQGYLERNYDGKYRLQTRPATYYLGLKALSWLKNQPQVSSKVIKTIYNNDNRASDAFIARSLAIFSLYLDLRTSDFKFFSKSELYDFDYFPKQLLDAYLSRKTFQDQLVNEIFVSYIPESMPYFAIRQRFQQMSTYYDSDQWEGEDNQMPAWLIVCQSEKLVRRITKNFSKLIDEDSEIKLYITTMDNAGIIDRWQELSSISDD